jgi:phage anti-repressor protein
MTRKTYEEICKEMEEGIFNANDWSGCNANDAFELGREFGAFEESKNHAAEIDMVKKKAYDSGIQDLRDCQSGSWR